MPYCQTIVEGVVRPLFPKMDWFHNPSQVIASAQSAVTQAAHTPTDIYTSRYAVGSSAGFVSCYPVIARHRRTSQLRGFDFYPALICPS